MSAIRVVDGNSAEQENYPSAPDNHRGSPRPVCLPRRRYLVLKLQSLTAVAALMQHASLPPSNARYRHTVLGGHTYATVRAGNVPEGKLTRGVTWVSPGGHTQGCNWVVACIARTGTAPIASLCGQNDSHQSVSVTRRGFSLRKCNDPCTSRRLKGRQTRYQEFDFVSTKPSTG